MKSIISPVIIYLFCSCSLKAQDANSIRIMAGEDIRQVVPANKLYRNPEFREGKVFLKNSQRVTAKLNYQIFSGEMQFIDQKSDTLALADPNTVEFIIIGEKIFYYDNGYFEVVAGYGSTSLAIQLWIRTTDVEKKGGYDQSTSTSSIENYRNFSDNNGSYHNLKVNKTMTLSWDSSFFIGDKYNHFLPANKKIIQNLFPKEERAIKDYLAKNHINFKNEEDLKKLLLFCSELQ